MENQEKTMRPIPKNVRQIGELDSEVRLYVEDYVNTFIRKCAKGSGLVLGALVGDWYPGEDKEYLFVEGAVQAEGFYVADGRIRMADEVWSGLYGKLEEFFGGKSICGWFLCGRETESCDVGMLREFMYENLGREKRALIVCDTEREEEAFYVYDREFIREQSGYYLFYERNESMQSYMVTTSVAVRTDPVAVDAVTVGVRTRTVSPREIPPRQAGSPMISAAALVIGVIALAFGIVTINHYEQLKEMKSVLTGLTGALLGNPETESSTAESTEGDEDRTVGGLIIEDVEGGVDISTEEITTEEVEDAGATEGTEGTEAGDNAEPSETAGENSVEGNVTPTGSDETTVNAEQEPATEVVSPEYRAYVVEAGETLVSICWSVYGRRDESLIEKICEINQIADKNQIYVGQKLLIP